MTSITGLIQATLLLKCLGRVAAETQAPFAGSVNGNVCGLDVSHTPRGFYRDKMFVRDHASDILSGLPIREATVLEIPTASPNLEDDAGLAIGPAETPFNQAQLHQEVSDGFIQAMPEQIEPVSFVVTDSDEAHKSVSDDVMSGAVPGHKHDDPATASSNSEFVERAWGSAKETAAETFAWIVPEEWEVTSNFPTPVLPVAVKSWFNRMLRPIEEGFACNVTNLPRSIGRLRALLSTPIYEKPPPFYNGGCVLRDAAHCATYPDQCVDPDAVNRWFILGEHHYVQQFFVAALARQFALYRSVVKTILGVDFMRYSLLGLAVLSRLIALGFSIIKYATKFVVLIPIVLFFMIGTALRALYMTADILAHIFINVAIQYKSIYFAFRAGLDLA